MTPRKLNAVRRWFHRRSGEFCAMAEDRRGPAGRLFDALFRKNVSERFARTCEELAPLEGSTILDAGCGPGRYAVHFAEQGARVVGVDLVPSMLENARALAASRGVAELCRFIEDDIVTAGLEGPFDHAVAVGLLDYTDDPAAVLRAVGRPTRGKVLVTFPRLLTPRTALRCLWLRLNRCPVRFYTRRSILRAFAEAGFAPPTITTMRSLFYVVARGTFD